MIVCSDFNKRTCIQVDRENGRIKYIPLDVGEGLRVLKASSAEFDSRYKPIAGYPIDRAVKLYLSYGRDIGVTKEALDFLGQVIDIPNKESLMATTKKRQEATTVVKEKRTTPSARRVIDSAVSPAKAGRRKVDTVTRPVKRPTGEKRISAAQMFQDLIMEGKLTDDKIFAKVQEKFDLDDSKRGYVKWYRNHLKKQGQNPPEAR